MILKAYARSCRDDDHGGDVVFASNAKEAKSFGALDRCDCEYIYRRVRRAHDFDNLFPGPVTIRDYLARGWRWGCGSCGSMVYGDEEFTVHVEEGAEILTCGRCFPIAARQGAKA